MSKIKLFETQQVRTYWDDNEETWFFAIVDVIEILTESVKPRDYWYRLKKRELNGPTFFTTQNYDNFLEFMNSHSSIQNGDSPPYFIHSSKKKLIQYNCLHCDT